MSEYHAILEKPPFSLNSAQTQKVLELLEGMSLKEKTAQVFCVELRATETLSLPGAGAVMLLPDSFDKLYDVNVRLRRETKIPPLVGGNLEEGADAIREGTNIGNLLEIGAAADAAEAGKLGQVTGYEAAAVGFNWAFAPVTDIAFSWRNPVIATRVFGCDPDFTADASAQYIISLQKEGVACAVKHFPGDGVDERDQHFHPSVNSLSVEEWEKSFGKVYRRCIEAGAKTFMVGHIMQPALTRLVNPEIADEDILPGSTSKELLQGILRERLGFNGLISTDSTNMSGFDQILPREKAIPTAIAAGCDMLLFTKDPEQDLAYLRHGVETGLLTEERLNEAVLRILGLKASLGLLDGLPLLPKEKARARIGQQYASETAEHLAEHAITLVKDRDGILPLSPEKTKRIYLVPFVEGRGFGSDRESFATYLKQQLEAEGFVVTVQPEAGTNTPLRLNGDALRTECDLILYAANLNSISNKTVTRLDWGSSMGKDAPCHIHEVPTLFLSFGNPYHLVDVPRVRTMVNAYKFNRPVVSKVIDKLMGRSPFVGKNPVDPFCGLWDARL